ncbi:antirestriction protein ArdA [Streptomyces sp. NPDC048644]|uniref:antirestriction protein ArdA n=1 Tax=Streptomyces sp. NPDC048644 TaxID=3365582 RepID=UPI0037112405
MAENMMKPQIYVVSLADYNSGRHHGVWIDADQDADDIRVEIKVMLDRSPTGDAEDYAIHDCEDFGDVKLSEFTNIGAVAQLAKLITEHPVELVAHFHGEGYAVDDIGDEIENRSRGVWESLADLALEDIGGDLPERFQDHVWTLAKAIAGDWEEAGAYTTIRTPDGVAVLSND